ncbi:ImmA/IrrE family metallo-endopeptidase [Tritonibacter aquimaris]|nr:ImmA/IrrE family metallo-endopeptidase [Tritonibacter aquimaris]
MTRTPNFKRASREAKRARAELPRFPPYDPEAVAESNGIEVVYASFDAPHDKEISGFYHKAEDKIVVNREISAGRMVFTIAHELGHALMHQDYIESQNYQPVYRSNNHEGEKPIEEVEADQFAANFLVPLDLLEKYRDVADIGELARMFAVSEDVIENRLSTLHRNPWLAKS